MDQNDQVSIALDEVRNEHPDTVTETDSDARQIHWYRHIYQGDKVPQLTVRAVLMGGILGSAMSISNLYTTLKLGWAFGVAITACVLSYVIWNSIRSVARNVTPMTILENNCMQSTASAAGYSTGATIGTAFGAHLLITGHHIEWPILLGWTFLTGLLGVFLAIPLKRQMINHEQLAFPTGIAAAETLRSLYSQSKEAVHQAYVLVGAIVAGATIAVLRTGDFPALRTFKIKELVEFPYKIKGDSLPSFGWEPSLLLMGAGMIIGMRVSLSMLVGSMILYFIVGPMMIERGEVAAAHTLLKWSLWTGTAVMVTSGLTAFALQWKTIARSFTGFKPTKNAESSNPLAEFDHIEVPNRWFIIGVIPLAICMAILEYVAFSISLPLGLLSTVLSFVLALVACRSTGETDVTPIGAMGKITQLLYSVMAPGNMVTNLMTASVTANTAVSSADLLTDLKSGYLLGANPRRQFWAQFIGVFFGTAAIVPAWYLMVPTKEALEKFNPPSTNMWKAVAEALSVGISAIPETARIGILVGGAIGILIPVLEHFLPKTRKWMPSAMGLGLSWVMPFSNCFAFFLGALVATVWTRVNKKTADAFVVPVASGAIAGESLACAVIAILAAAAAIAVK